MTPAEKKTLADSLARQTRLLQDRAELALESFRTHQETAIALAKQGATEQLLEEHRDLATFFYEAFLDISIHATKLLRRLDELSK